MSWLSDFLSGKSGAGALFDQASMLGDQGLASLMEGFERSREILDANTKSVMAGYQRGLAEIDRIGEVARRQVMDQTTMNIAAAGQGAAARGLDNTTVRDGYEQMALREGNFALAGVNENIAGLRSNYRQQMSNFEAGMGSRQAGLETQAGMATSGYYQDLMAAVLQQAGAVGQGTAQRNQQLGQAAGTAASFAALAMLG